ncbi:MAG: 3 beta-hydroxysteroid dehydrogenase/Delta 5--_4-isomerase [Firmicutes bacterium ADurb.Bin182]|nr:MAG: 3 beta-hydroxysteroid dehydrogenase/Delta 5-->4-isomerase [Firmicutes bacterium ADurb.Bin182]
MNELYLVTGAAGHLGSAVTRRLLELKKNVRALVLPGEKLLTQGNIEVFCGDVRDKDSLVPFFTDNGGRDLLVIHCAGIVTIESRYRQQVYDVNVGGTKNIAELCERFKAKKLVYVSSVHAIPEKPKGETITEVTLFDPDKAVGQYAKTKSEATSIVLEAACKGLDASVVHPSGIIGPFETGRGHMTALIIDYCKRRLISAISGGYDFVDVRDVADGIISCCEKGRKGECYILSGRYATVKELLYMLHEITGKKEIKSYLPLWFVKLTAPLAELYYKILRRPPLYTAYSVYTVGSNSLFSHEKASKELGYKTRDMKQTLADTVKYLCDNKKICLN